MAGPQEVDTGLAGSLAFRAVRFAFLLSLFAAGGFSQPANPFGADAKAAETGLGIFRVYCGSCHGKLAKGGRAPDLTRGSFHSGDADADLFRTIASGIPGSEMAAYADRISSENIWRIIAFLRSSSHPEPAPAGDSEAGEKLFWGKGGCAACHAIGARGNPLGPELTSIGRQRSASYLRTSLVDPSADIVRDFGGVTVIGRDGSSTRGIEKWLDDFSVVLVDFSGRVSSFDRAAVRSVTRDTESLMPSYRTAFTTAEVNDVLAFLASLGTKP